jgi:hypothetical protein
MTPKSTDPRYPIHGVKIVDHAVFDVMAEMADVLDADSVSVPRGSFFALKPGERGKHGTIGGEAREDNAQS